MMKEEMNTGSLNRMCDVCQSTVCTVYCRADLAYLCAACDADIHSVNPLARRHTRITILPLNPDPVVGDTGGFLGMEEEEDGEEDVAFWLLGNPVKTVQNNNWDLFGDEYLDFIEYNSNTNNAELNIDHCNKSNGYNTDQLLQNREENREEDSIVPVQCEEKNGSSNKQPKLTFQLGLEHDSSKSGYGYPSSMSHSVSISSIDVGVVPQSTNNEVSNSHTRPPKGTIDLFTGGALHIPAQLTPMDREARVLRYREKKKTRKFQKTIRYASRKAYAETRPRIKGRFAKRTEFDVEVDQMFYCNSLMSDTGYDGIVPSF